MAAAQRGPGNGTDPENPSGEDGNHAREENRISSLEAGEGGGDRDAALDPLLRPENGEGQPRLRPDAGGPMYPAGGAPEAPPRDAEEDRVRPGDRKRGRDGGNP